MRENVKIKILQNILKEVTNKYDYFISQKEQTLQKTFEKAIKDSLTGFYNKEYMFDYLTKLYKKAQRENFEFLLIFLDVDNFKSVNDTYGHEKGDEILKQVVKFIKDSFRDYDTFVRYGGDEFIVILEIRQKDCLEEMLKLLEKLNERIKTEFKKYNLFISFGIALSPEAKNIHQLIELADMRMYQMKKEHHLKDT